MIGGANDSPSLLQRDFNATRSCFKIDIFSGKFTQQSDMLAGRDDFGVTLAANYFVYVVSSTCERYNILKDRWSTVPSFPTKFV